MVEITLRDGTVVRCRPVPDYATAQAALQFPSPPMPTVGQETADGRIEYHPAAIGSPAMDAHQLKLDELRMKQSYAAMELNYDFGVVEWMPLPAMERTPEGSAWISEPPKQWKFPKALIRHGVKSTGDRRTDYIAFALLAHGADHEAFLRAIGDKTQLTEAEVFAALASFPDEVARRIVSEVASKWSDDTERTV